MKIQPVLASIATALVWLQPAVAAASVPHFAPWQCLDLYTGTATRVGRMLPLAAEGTAWQGLPEHGAVLLIGADNGGALRSIDLGRRFETTNGGRGFCGSVCGGYSEADGLTTMFPGTNSLVCPVGGGPAAYPLLHGGPPALTAAFSGLDSDVSDFATSALPPGLWSALSQTGVAPSGEPGFANGLVYRASNHLYVSPDAGASWFPTAPQCDMNASYPNIRVVATDRARPGHVVIGANNHLGGRLAFNVST